MNTRLTAENKTQIATQALETMNDAEKKLLMQVMLRSMLLDPMGDAVRAFNGDKQALAKVKGHQYDFLPNGKTIREVLQEQQKLNTKH